MSAPQDSLRHLVPIDLGGRSYEIHIGLGLIGQSSQWDALSDAAAALIVTNETVAPLYAEPLRQSLSARFRRVDCLALPDGEAHKNWTTLNTVFDALLAAGADRKTIVFALGGGVVGDIAGFAAACYMRGIAFVQVPTTLLAQVDSSVGGKTGINHPLGKNMIGAFHQPLRVVADLATLATLPERELNAGLAEVVKYGAVADDSFLGWIEHNLAAMQAREPRALAYAVKRSCEIKARVVAQDEREQGLRAILNFGHTFGHAIEAGLGFGEWLHGEAVGCGMVMAADLSSRLGFVDAAYVGRLMRLIERAGLPVVGPRLGTARYLELMRADKKAQAGTIRFVLVESPGRAGLHRAPDDAVARVIDAHTR